MADALALGASGSNSMGVQVSPSAQMHVMHFARLEGRSATARGGVAGFFSRKIPVAKSPPRHIIKYLTFILISAMLTVYE